MCALPVLLPCPLCAHPHFDKVEALRDKLILVSTHTLTCPVCQEEMSGLDKLTIHLFSHVKMEENSASNECEQIQAQSQKSDGKPAERPPVCKRTRSQPTKNKAAASAQAPVKFVKIYPKLPVISLNTMPIIEMGRSRLSDNVNGPVPVRTTSLPANPRLETASAHLQHCCDVCGIHLTDEHILKMHKSLIHNHNMSAETSLALEKFPCHLCSKDFKMKGSLMVHLRVAHYGIPSNSTKEVTIPNYTNPNAIPETANTSDVQPNAKLFVTERNENKQWFCEVCEKSFTTKYFLKKHKRLHTGETPYACVQCSKTFTFQQSYHKHLLYHNDEKPHNCAYCGRSFKELSTLHNHQRIHTGEKPFSCETCGKCFRQRVSYLVHRRIHTGVMPYKCTACDKSFRYKVSQRTHKCAVQPPGTVIRQSGELLEKLKKKHNENDTMPTKSVEQSHLYNAYSVVSEVNADLIRTGAKLSFEDTEADNFTLISKSPARDFEAHDVDEFNALNENSKSTDKGVPSPSEIFKNLCLNNYNDDLSNNVQSRTPELINNDLNLEAIYNEFNQFL